MLDTLKSLLKEQIKDLYSAENQVLKALPKMVGAASSESVRDAFESQIEDTQGHVERLEQAAELLDTKPEGKKCKAMEGLVAEGKQALEEEGEQAVIEAALIAAAQRVEHYEISAYGSACAVAEQIDEGPVTELLQANLDEVTAAEGKLATIFTDEVLPASIEATQERQAAAERAGPLLS